MIAPTVSFRMPALTFYFKDKWVQLGRFESQSDFGRKCQYVPSIMQKQ